MRYFLENELLKCEFDNHGAELKSVMTKKDNREYMWYGNGKYWGRSAPVLFPFVGKLKDLKYTWKGQEYSMGQHGFARDTDFEMISCEGNEMRFLMKSTEESKKKYPFDFTLEIVYTLEKTALNVRWIVTNTGDEDMHFSIGAHPAFLCPVHGEKDKAGYRLVFKDAEEIHHYGNSRDKGLAMDEDLVLKLENETAVLTADFFDRTTYIVDGHQCQDVILEDPEGKPVVEVTFDAPLFGVWSPEEKNAPFLCIEPWYGRCDAEDFEGDLSERAFSNKLAAGEVFDKNYTMTYFEL